MNQQEKEKIAILRKEGLGYKKISNQLGVNLNTVKSYCRNNNLTISSLYNISKCKNCGKTIELVPKRKVRIFCCKKCKSQWWNLNRDKAKKTSKIEIICQNCGKTFKAYKWENRKYCGLDCYYDNGING